MTAYYNENNPEAAAWLRQLVDADLIAPGDVDERDIQDVLPSELMGYTQCHFFAGIGGWSYALRLAGWPDRAPVWTASLPCQPFSQAGKGKGVADERHLWPEFFWYVQQCGPTAIFGEQSASKAGREWFAGVRSDLESVGYVAGASDLPAASVGTPHIRQRLWWGATNSNGPRLSQRNEHGASQSAAITSAWSELKRVHAEGAWKAWQAESAVPVFVDGVQGRVGLTRGYGNAIVPQIAAKFITAFSEATA